MHGVSPLVNVALVKRALTRAERFSVLSGLGAGMVGATGVIIMADAVPLSERGLFNGLFGLYVNIHYLWRYS